MRWLLLPALARFEDIALFALRAITGVFLVYQSHDNVLSAARMTEFAEFLAAHGFPAPAILAPFAIFWQMAAGIGFILGLAVRWLGVITAIQFAVACWMVHRHMDFAGWWPALILVFLGAYFATRGGGRIALDSSIERHGAGR